MMSIGPFLSPFLSTAMTFSSLILGHLHKRSSIGELYFVSGSDVRGRIKTFRPDEAISTIDKQQHGERAIWPSAKARIRVHLVNVLGQ
jgi:hypothetical protein